MIDILPNWHPIFVHFTVALLSVSIGLYFASCFMKKSELKNEWLIVARWSLWFGTGITVLTVLSGLYAYNTVAHDTLSHMAMTDHRNWAVTTATVFLILAVWSLWQFRQAKNNSMTFVMVLLLAGGLLGSTAWRGGEVVYRYGLGVMSMPGTGKEQSIDDSGIDGHEHEHGLMDGHDTVSIQEPVNNTDTDEQAQTPTNTTSVNKDPIKRPASDDGHNHEH